MMTPADWEQNFYYTGLTLQSVGLVFYAVHVWCPRSWSREGGWGSTLLAMLCFMLSLYFRSLHAQYFALSNMYESLLVVCLGIQLSFTVLERRFKLRMLGLPVAAMLVLTLFYDLTLPTEIHPLQPALQSYWRSIHVPIILLSYALFTIAFLSSLVFLVKDAVTRLTGGSAQLATAGGIDTLEANSLVLRPEGLPSRSAASSVEAVELALARDQANIYDEITYRCVAFGFPLLTLGIILGGLWANEAWGNYWSWDPKESMSLVTLLGYGVYLHLRVNGEHKHRTLAWVSVIGFALMLVTYFGVNLMGVGLHSYGKIG
jgi:cytochrome c-type biogenesis protein CcsB